MVATGVSLVLELVSPLYGFHWLTEILELLFNVKSDRTTCAKFPLCRRFAANSVPKLSSTVHKGNIICS